jgi:hypothetical protein
VGKSRDLLWWLGYARYQAWFDRHVADNILRPVARRFRRGLPGTSLCDAAPGKARATQGTFIEPHSSRKLHNNVINDAFNIDVTQFATDMIASAEYWLATAETTPAYQANFPHCMQRYPAGLPPCIGGPPVIA